MSDSGVNAAEFVVVDADEYDAMRKDAELGRISLKYFDRMDDPADCDPLEKSVSEFLAKIRDAISSPENNY